MPKIVIETFVQCDQRIAFDLSRSIDLHQVSTAHTNEKAIAGRTSGLIELGETVTWRARHFGIYQNLTSKITEMHAPSYFVDEMVQGAFKSFRHEHRLEKAGEAILMIDIFDYCSPFGLLGNFVDWLFLKRYMTILLEKRNQVIKEFAESEKWKSVLQEENYNL